MFIPPPNTHSTYAYFSTLAPNIYSTPAIKNDTSSVHWVRCAVNERQKRVPFYNQHVFDEILWNFGYYNVLSTTLSFPNYLKSFIINVAVWWKPFSANYTSQSCFMIIFDKFSLALGKRNKIHSNFIFINHFGVCRASTLLIDCFMFCI